MAVVRFVNRVKQKVQYLQLEIDDIVDVYAFNGNVLQRQHFKARSVAGIDVAVSDSAELDLALILDRLAKLQDSEYMFDYVLDLFQTDACPLFHPCWPRIMSLSQGKREEDG